MMAASTKSLKPFRCPACNKPSQTSGVCDDCKQAAGMVPCEGCKRLTANRSGKCGVCLKATT